jgi:ankyrin repeat protein
MKSHLLLTTIAAVLLVGCGGANIALIKAAKDGDIEEVKRHLDADANVNAKDIAGKASKFSGQKGYTALHHASQGGHKEIVQLLIGKGADANAKAPKTSGGNTPIDLTREHPEITELLHKHGSIHSRMHRAVAVGYVKAVEACLDAGMNVNKNSALGTPLDQAIEWERTEVANFLRERGGKTSVELRQKR